MLTYDEEQKLLDRISELEVTVEAQDARIYQLDRTVYGIQQLLGKAAEYKGRPKGGLPKDRRNG